MKKPLLTSFTISCLLITLLLTGYSTPAKASPDTIHVPTDYTTIQEAINHANPGDIIIVHNRTYYENVFVNKSISLIGENAETTIIDGNAADSVISVKADNVTIKGFTIQNSGANEGDSGILVHHSSSNDISTNKITNNNHGISLNYSNNNAISGNIIFSNTIDGISLDYSNKNEISDNTISNNDYGIYLRYASNDNAISSNNVSDNYGGIWLYSSRDNTISDNTILNNDYGILLYSSSDNTISGNTISDNGNGIRLSHLGNNLIYHNNFIKGTEQAWSYNSVNAWDNGEEGNYWSEYTGQDLNKDGIGDTPHTIGDIRDNYPLMGNFSDFTVTWKDKIHHATIISNSTVSNFRFEMRRETGDKMIRFNVTGEDGTAGFCRVAIPTELMNYSSIVLIDGEETTSTLLDTPSKTHNYLYFTYIHSTHTITIISSKLIYLYNQLLDRHAELQIDFQSLNSTYHELLDNYNSLSAAYQELAGNYNQVLRKHNMLNASFQELLQNHTSLLLEHAQNLQNLTYVIIATTAIFIIAAIYLSTQAHRRVRAPLNRGAR